MHLESIRSASRKTILQFAIPSVIAMVLTSLITVVDGFFIGNYVGKEGLAAVNLGLPIVYLFLAVGLMVSVGGVAIAGMALGGKDMQGCNTAFNQTMCTAVVFTALLSVLTLFCIDPLLLFFNADALVAAYFKEYYLILLLQLPVMVVNASFGMFIRGEGNPVYFMRVNLVTVALNILLDYIFVRWLSWGVRGIALASLLATLAALVHIIWFFLRKSKIYKFRRFVFSKTILANTLLNGSSEFVGEMSLSVSMFAYNYSILKHVGIDGLSAFTIAGYVSYIFSMVLIGFGQGASPLISFAYGAKDRRLAANLRTRTNHMVLCAGVAVFVLAAVAAPWYSRLFVKSAMVQQLVRAGMVLFTASFLFSGVNTITSFYFTSIGKAKQSAIISAARGLVILLVCIFTLPPLLGMTGVWLVAPITEASTLLISLYFIKKDTHAL